MAQSSWNEPHEQDSVIDSVLSRIVSDKEDCLPQRPHTGDFDGVANQSRFRLLGDDSFYEWREVGIHLSFPLVHDAKSV